VKECEDVKTIVLTPGDPEGVGPEITWKVLKNFKSRTHRVLCVGARAPFDALGVRIIESEHAPRERRPHLWLRPAPVRAKGFLPGFQAGWSLETATHLVLSGEAHALVTGPISKERLQRGGYPYFGHTDFLADLCRGRAKRPLENTMMLANDQLRVSLVTTHLSLARVPAAITRAGIRRATLQTFEALRDHWRVPRPRIAICALNPHAGEAGLMGREEIEIIAPEVRALQRRLGARATLTGPLPADTLFTQKKRYDAVIAMYHDQGLIPVKLLDFPRTVNVTLGLPIVRTSVDHGVAFDLVGKNQADPTSLRCALELAIRFTQ
jgi:4-hydroxythreonine-4-phosphate dehydrogenase